LEIGLNLSLNLPLKLPVRVRLLDGVPKIIAGGIPVMPINLVLQQRQRETGATRSSLETYARAARLYVEFCAHRGQSLIGVSNEEFKWFRDALIGHPFLNADGGYVHLSGERGERTGDLMLTLLYSLAADIMERYNVTFDWVRYKGMSNQLIEAIRELKRPIDFRTFGLRRTHRIKFTAPKILGLPDDQFVRLLIATKERWLETIADGDVAFAKPPEAQRGGLFWRNIALLMVLRCVGSRRSEVVRLRMNDVDRGRSLIYLATKRHRERLPVLLYPWVGDLIFHYVTEFRPIVSSSLENQQAVFLSHSAQNYGERISDQSVRALIDVLRPALDPPWDEQLTPHMLRHSFGYDLQKLSGPAANVTNMRHASSRSSEPYQAAPETFADELLEPGNKMIQDFLAQAGILEALHR
jgi:integrase